MTKDRNKTPEITGAAKRPSPSKSSKGDMTRAFEIVAVLPIDGVHDGRGDTPPQERDDL